MKIYVIEHHAKNKSHIETTNTYRKGAREANLAETIAWIYRMQILFPIYRIMGKVNIK